MRKLTVQQEESLVKLKRTIDRLLEANKKVEDCCWEYSSYSQEYRDELWDTLECSKHYLTHNLNNVLKDFSEE